jgi:hypothetical protein
MIKVREQNNTITINGKTFQCSGGNITISNGKVIVDGKIIESNIGCNAEIVINGNVNKIDCDYNVVVYGNSGSIDCGGSCTVDGNVKGNVDASGSVKCGNVSGDINAGGSVSCKR